MIPFDRASYRAQVIRLRALAEEALKHQKMKVESLRFVNHGENTTFQVITRKPSTKFLLRIHRNDYHTPQAIEEELRWLHRLYESGIPVPDPVRNRHGQWITQVELPETGKRNVTLSHWVDGRFLSRSVSEKKLRSIGVLLGRVQKVSPGGPVRHRRYWDAQGLLGPKAKFGPIDELRGASAADQRLITRTRIDTLARLSAYEKRHPSRMGMIHADLHFGNLLVTPSKEIGAIDFDDSGFGFHVYDLAIPLIGVFHMLKEAKRSREYPRMKDALLEGYASVATWSAQDMELLSDLILARRLLMLGWLQSRSDHPVLRARLRSSIRRVVQYIRKRDH